MTLPGCVNDFGDIQADSRKMAHTKGLINSVASYNKEAGLMVLYLSEFVQLACAPDMLALRVFPNGKEISESFAAYDAARYRLQDHALGDPTITMVAVGDGHTPRTGATFAFRTAWACHSVDPQMRGGSVRWAPIRRLTVHAAKIQDICIEADRAVLVAVHSHADLRESVSAIRAKSVAVIAIPCCKRMELDREPDIQYEDRSVISPCRTVKIWKSA